MALIPSGSPNQAGDPITDKRQVTPSEQLFRVTADSAPAILWTTDPAGLCTYLSRQWYELTGQQTDEGLGFGWVAAVHPDDRDPAGEIFMGANARQEPFELDYRLRRRDGEYIWAIDAGRPRFSEAGEFLGYVGSVLDISERKAAEAALRHSERLLADAEQIAQFGSWEWHLADDEMTWSSGLYRIHSLQPGTPVTRDAFAALIHADDRARVAATIDRAVHDRSAFDYDYRIMRPDGEERILQGRGNVVLDVDAQPIRVVGTIHDITETRQAETRLRRSEEHFRALIENGADLIAVLNPDGTGRYVSPSYARMLGYELSEEMDSNSLQHVHADDLPRVLAALQELTRAPNATVRLELRVQHQNRSWLTLQVSAVNMTDVPAVRGIVINARDVTEQRRAEQRLLRVTATSPAVLYTLVWDGESMRPSWVSSNIETLFGYSVEQALHPEWWYGNLHADDRDAAVRAVLNALRTGFLSHEYRFRHKDGSYRWIRDQLKVLGEAEGPATEIVGSWMDATDFRQLENQFHQAQKLEAVGRLAGGIAHDFNNVLTAVQGFAQMMLDDFDDSHELWRDAREIVRASERGARLVRQLMEFSRQQVIQPQVIRLNTVVAGMERMLRRLIGEDVSFVTDLHSAGGYVRADRGQLEQVLLNLVVNARDAMPEGGRLTIATASVDLTQDPTGYTDIVPGRYVELTITDTGCGMDQDVQEKIFEPFFTTKDQEKGTGLGLSIVYGIVRQSGGGIRLESDVDRGSSFRIYLPEVEPVAATEPEPEREVRPSNSEMVLLVEDQSSVRAFARRVLERKGYRVIEAENGKEALRMVELNSTRIDLLLTDVVMPHMSGRELAARVLELRPGVRVLFMSGHVEGEIADRGVLRPGMHFIEKPFTPDALARKAREVLDAGPERVHADDR